MSYKTQKISHHNLNNKNGLFNKKCFEIYHLLILLDQTFISSNICDQTSFQLDLLYSLGSITSKCNAWQNGVDLLYIFFKLFFFVVVEVWTP